MNTYTPTIGLEIHAELKTRTKMFCNSANDPHAAEPNVHICPVCMAFPGTLPVINKEAVHHVLRVGTALNAELADYTEFDRKNYFYPDIPKGYQISQYQYPLVRKGSLVGVPITRVHLEEDTARSQHKDSWSLIDFNRAGVPLMELVTEPVIHDAKTASRFAQELQLLLRALGASDANMEKGEMRVEANISVSKDETLGTRVEVKNLNSFKVVEKAIEHEIKRHIKVLEGGGEIVQETRGWSEARSETFSQRVKESSEDYRYFPDPDLPKLKLSEISEFSKTHIQKTLPELPSDKRDRYVSLGLKEEDADTLVKDSRYGNFFDSEILTHFSEKDSIRLAINYLTSDIRGPETGDRELKNVSGGAFCELITLVENRELSSRSAKDLLRRLLKEGGSPREIAEKENLLQVHDTEALKEIAKEVVAENTSVVNDFKAGKESALQFLVGQGMKKSRGTANPKELAKLLQEVIK